MTSARRRTMPSAVRTAAQLRCRPPSPRITPPRQPTGSRDSQRNDDGGGRPRERAGPQVFDALREIVVPRRRPDAHGHAALALERRGKGDDIGVLHLWSPIDRKLNALYMGTA